MKIVTRRQRIRALTERLEATAVALGAAMNEQRRLAAQLRSAEQRMVELNNRIIKCSAFRSYDAVARERIAIKIELDPFVLFSYPTAERQKYIDYAVQRMLRQLNEHLLHPDCMR